MPSFEESRTAHEDQTSKDVKTVDLPMYYPLLSPEHELTRNTVILDTFLEYRTPKTHGLTD